MVIGSGSNFFFLVREDKNHIPDEAPGPPFVLTRLLGRDRVCLSVLVGSFISRLDAKTRQSAQSGDRDSEPLSGASLQ